MKERITLQQLVAYNNTPKAKALIVKYGYKPAKSYNDLTYKLFRFTKDFKEEALQEIAKIHPHKELILNYECKTPEVEKVEVLTSKNTKTNFEGEWGDECQCRECRKKRMMGFQNFMNFEGENIQPQNKSAEPTPSIMSMFPLIAISGIVAIGFYIAFSKKG
jgi:hypothetical protein